MNNSTMKHKHKNGRGGRNASLLKGRPRTDLIPKGKERPGLGQIQELWTPLYPARARRRLRYASAISITTTLGVPQLYLFAANGLYDPDLTSTGHQPMGFDQIMLSYNHYVVENAKIVVTFRNSSTANSPTVAIRVDANSASLTSPDQIIEYGAVNMETLTYKGAYGSNLALEMSVNIRKMQGVSRIEDDPNLRGSLTSNPTELTNFHVLVWDNLGVTSTVICDVIIEFDALFTEPRDLSLSLEPRQLRNLLLAGEAKAETRQPRVGGTANPNSFKLSPPIKGVTEKS